MSSAKRILFYLLLLALIIAGIAYYVLQQFTTNNKTSQNKQPTIPVITQTAYLGQLPVQIRSIGTVISPHSVDIRPRVDGELVELLIKQGSTVTKGSLLARIDDRELRANLQQEKAELTNRQAQLNNAMLDMKRYQQLKKQNAISGQIFDQQQALVSQLQAQIATQKAVIEAKETSLTHTQITSPIDGVVGIVGIHEGNYIRTSDAQPLFSIVQVDPIAVEIGIPQKQLPKLLPLARENQLTQIAVLAFDQEEQTLLATGHLEVIDNQVSAQTGTLKARAIFDNANHALWPGQTVIAKIQTQILDPVVIIPKKAVQQGNKINYVWRIQNNTAHMTPIEIRHCDGEKCAITELRAGDEIVIDGASRLREGYLVEKSSTSPTYQDDAQDILQNEQDNPLTSTSHE